MKSTILIIGVGITFSSCFMFKPYAVIKTLKVRPKKINLEDNIEISINASLFMRYYRDGIQINAVVLDQDINSNVQVLLNESKFKSDKGQVDSIDVGNTSREVFIPLKFSHIDEISVLPLKLDSIPVIINDDTSYFNTEINMRKKIY